MLQQILDTGYIDPEVKELLTEEQKELLYRKIRVEQVRKWRAREESREQMKRRTHRKVNFLSGADGNPWVWVMGDHPGDLPYEEMVRKKEIEEAEREAEALREEAEKLAKKETADFLKAASKKTSAMESMDGKESPVRIRFLDARSESMIDLESLDSPEREKKPSTKALWKKAVDHLPELIKSMSPEERESYEKRRMEEILQYMMHAAKVKKERSSQITSNTLSKWQESEEKAKSYERKRKMSIHRAKQIEEREKDAAENILKRLSNEGLAPVLKSAPQSAGVRTGPTSGRDEFRSRRNALPTRSQLRPKTPRHVTGWFREIEAPKGVGREVDGAISLWFHGNIDRQSADDLLQPMAVGGFLVRMSMRVKHYTISVKGHSNVKHFLVEASSAGTYRFIGPEQPTFPSLSKLLNYYRTNPITWLGKEMLLVPCEQTYQQLQNVQLLYQREDDDEEEEEDEDEDDFSNEITLL